MCFGRNLYLLRKWLFGFFVFLYRGYFLGSEGWEVSCIWCGCWCLGELVNGWSCDFIIFVLFMVWIFFNNECKVCEILGLMEVRVCDCSFVLYCCLMSFGRLEWRSFSYVSMMKFLSVGVSFLFLLIGLLLWEILFLCFSRLFFMNDINFWYKFFGFFFGFNLMLVKLMKCVLVDWKL